MKPIIWGALLFCIGYFVVQYQNMGSDIRSFQSDTTARGTTTRRLSGKVDTLKADTARLSRLYLKEQGLRLQGEVTAERLRADKNATLARLNLASGRNDALTDALSATRKKAEADAAVRASGYGVLTTSVNDSLTNGIIVKQDRQIRQYRDTIVPALAQQNADLTEQNRVLEAERRAGLDIISNLNGDIADTRTLVQDERAKASKGIVRKVFNGGRIKALGKVDARLGEVQKKK